MADEVAHLVKEPGEPCYYKLVELLGSEILETSGHIDKKKMADRIFNDEELLKKVNDIIHPAVKDYIISAMKEASADKDIELFFVEAALLIEAGYGDILDELWYIYAEKEVRRKRLTDIRGYSAEKIESIFASQLSEDEFRDKCSFVIDNSSTLEHSYEQINKRLEAYTWQE
jgi:dephospho-CoA kinase